VQPQNVPAPSPTPTAAGNVLTPVGPASVPPARVSSPSPSTVDKKKGGEPERKESFKPTLNAEDQRRSRQDIAQRRGQQKKEKKLAKVRWGDKFLEHLKNHAEQTQDVEDQALATNLEERLKSVKSDDEQMSAGADEDKEEEDDDSWEL